MLDEDCFWISNLASELIDDASIYGIDEMTSRLWFRIPGSNTDEFIQIANHDLAQANQFIACSGLMQQAKTAPN